MYHKSNNSLRSGREARGKSEAAIIQKEEGLESSEVEMRRHRTRSKQTSKMSTIG
jgi:hypothetical protein